MKSAAMVALLALLAVPLAAQDRNIQITVLASQTEYQGENDFDDLGFETDFEEGSGFGGTINWFVNPYVSIEGSVFGFRSDASLIFEQQAVIDLGTLNLTMFGAGAQLHLLGQRRLDPYVGAGGAYIIGDDFFTPDLEAGGVGRIELANEFGYYVNAGIGLQITEGFGVVVDARYIPYETSSRSTVTGFEEELEIAPRIYSAGVRLRF
jgi:opacity protein-like surface antigen